MRIYHVNTTFGYNAPGSLVRLLARGAAGAGHVVRAAFSAAYPVARGEEGPVSLFPVGGRLSRVCHALRTRLTDGHGLGSGRATRALVADIARFSPDVVHLHNLHGYWLDVPALTRFLAGSGVRVVWTLHDFWPLTGHCAFPQQSDCRRWTTEGCHNCPQLGSYPASWGVDRSAANFRLKRDIFSSLPRLDVVALSNWQLGEVQRSFLGDLPCRVIPNPVDPAMRAPADVVREPRTVLGAASVWDDRKGLGRFIELRRLLPGDVRIRLAGLSSRQIRALPPGIEGLPRISATADMARFLAGGALFVNLSRAETLGMVNLEARSCGTPVVSLRSGGLAETVSPLSGVLVDGDDMPGVAAAVLDALRPGRRHNADISAEAARQFSPAVAVNAYLRLYTS